MNRIFACLILILVLIAPPSAHAAPLTCDATLFLAGQLTALQDTNPDIEPGVIHWSYVDPPYQVDYWYSGGMVGFIYRLHIRQNGKLVGLASNGAWEVCGKGNGWKRYLLHTLAGYTPIRNESA